MELSQERIRSLVDQVTHELTESGALPAQTPRRRAEDRRPGSYAGGFAGGGTTTEPNRGPSRPYGVHESLDAAVRLAGQSQQELHALPLETRARILESIRNKCRDHVRLLAELAVSETGMGRVEDKIQKNRLVIDRTPGIEDLEPIAWTGDHGMSLTEWAPYGVIGAAGPSTNPSETIINNGIGMIAGGNAVVFAPHPSAKRVCQTTISLINEASLESGGPENLITTVAEPTIESAQAMMRHKDTKLLVVTGGPGVVREAMASGKKVIAAGPGNPPVVVDTTADLVRAGRDIVNGASLDNNVVCTDEKEVFVVERAADALLTAMQRAGAYLANAGETEKLRKLVLAEDRGPRRHSVVNREWIGKNAGVLLSAIGVSIDADVRLIVCDVPPEHPFVWSELLMPVLGVARVGSAEQAIEWAVSAEHGFRHTASIHSKNIDHLSEMAQRMNCSIFVKNGPNYAGLGMGGEGPTSFTIASPTGEGMTTARCFTRRRRCTLVDSFRIV